MIILICKGGILALDYVKKYPEKVNSIIIIGTPYDIPKVLFKIQSMIFHFMPDSQFNDMGCSKKDFITLVNSMSNHNIKNGLDKINCKSLILCGSKDKANMKSANLMGRIFNYFEFTFSYTLTNLFRSVDRIDRGSSCRCKLYFGRGI